MTAATADAQITEAHRRAAVAANFGEPLHGCHWARWIVDWMETGEHQGPVMPDGLLRTAQLIANERRDAERDGRIAGMREGVELARENLEMKSIGTQYNPWEVPDWQPVDEALAKRTAELESGR
jgi:hypothetical protein